MQKYFIIALLFIFCTTAEAQKKNSQGSKKAAKNFLGYEDYNRALSELLKIYKQDKRDIKTNLNIGICYLNVNDDRSKAIPYFEFVLNNSDYKYEVLLYTGMAYAYHYEFDKAISYYYKYIEKCTPEEKGLAEHFIENCEAAKELIKKPVNVSFQNLGKEINSKAPDYYPFVSGDEGTLYYTTRRSATKGELESENGYFTSDIYVSKVDKGEWTKGKNAGALINTEEDEQCVYLTPSAKTMIIYMSHAMDSDELYISTVAGKKQTMPAPVVLDGPVNKNSYFELEACITEDESMLIISSDRDGGFGGCDLYSIKKLPNGKWGEPVNLGPKINTGFDENFPMYDEKTNMLYFASQGHTGMGGYDIFKSKFNTDTKTYAPPVNMGYPINTPEDNMQISLAKNKRDAYISAHRKEGFGDLDIYKVIFNDIENTPSVIKGVISTADTSKKEIEAMITIVDKKTNEELDSKDVNPQSGRYIFAVEPGKYILKVSCSGYVDHTEEINVYDKANYIFEIEKNIILQKPPVKPATTK